MNKGMAKQLFASAGIPAPRGIAMKKENREDDVTKLPLTLPCVVKAMLRRVQYRRDDCQGCSRV